jgi:hypothetical protein
MSCLSIQEKIQCLKNLLNDPDDWISFELLRLAEEEDETEPETSDRPAGKSESCPEASKRSSKRR